MTPTLHEKLQEREDSVDPEWAAKMRVTCANLDRALRRHRAGRRYQRRKVGHTRPFVSRLAWMQARRRGRA